MATGGSSSRRRALERVSFDRGCRNGTQWAPRLQWEESKQKPDIRPRSPAYLARGPFSWCHDILFYRGSTSRLFQTVFYFILLSSFLFFKHSEQWTSSILPASSPLVTFVRAWWCHYRERKFLSTFPANGEENVNACSSLFHRVINRRTKVLPCGMIAS